MIKEWNLKASVMPVCKTINFNRATSSLKNNNNDEPQTVQTGQGRLTLS